MEYINKIITQELKAKFFIQQVFLNQYNFRFNSINTYMVQIIYRDDMFSVLDKLKRQNKILGYEVNLMSNTQRDIMTELTIQSTPQIENRYLTSDFIPQKKLKKFFF